MIKDPAVLRVRKEIMPAIEAYEKTVTSGKPFGCKTTLQKVVKIYDECKKGLNGSMPSANKIGYGHIRDKMNEAMAYHDLTHSY
jgi:hypothetical protein